MIISKIIQNGLDLSIETNEIPFQYSANLYIQFVKDEKYKDWNLQGYYALPKTYLSKSEEYKLTIDNDGLIKLNAEMFARVGSLQLSFELIENTTDGANVHLGIVTYTIRKAIGNSQTIPSGKKELLYELVEAKVDNYFNQNYSSKLNDFNNKYTDFSEKYSQIQTEANGIVETAKEVQNNHDEVVKLKQDIDSTKQNVNETKQQIDGTYAEYKQYANETKQEIVNAKQDIINGKKEINDLSKEKVNAYNQLAEDFETNYNEKSQNFNNNATNKTEDFDNNVTNKTNSFNTSYDQKVTDFNNNYTDKTKSLDTKISQIQTEANGIVETAKEEIAQSKDEALTSLSDKETEAKNTINSNKNSALADINDKRVESLDDIEEKAKSYQVQLDELKETNEGQAIQIENLKATVDTKVTSPYINNNDNTHITTSDNGLMSNLVIKGNTVQESTNGYQLLNYTKLASTTLNGVILINNMDGSFTLKGTCNNDNNFGSDYFTLDAGDYKLIDYAQGSFPNTINARVQIIDSENLADISAIATNNNDSTNSVKSASLRKSEKYQLRIRISNGHTYNCTLRPMLYQQGDGTFEPYTGAKPSPSPEYPQEVKGIDKIEGKVIGKNLLNPNDVKAGYISDSNGTFIYHIASTCTNFIEVKPSTQYYIGADMTNSMWAAYYDKDKTFINGFTGYNKVITTPENAYFVMLTISYNNSNPNYQDNVFLYEASETNQKFTRYQDAQQILYTLQNPLYKLSDTVYDYIDLSKGKIVRNVGVVDFDGSDDEEWHKNNSEDDTSYLYYAKLNHNISQAGKCNKLHEYFGHVTNDFGYYLRSSAEHMYLNIGALTSSNDIQSLKTYLSKNPITVYYQLSTPTEEDIPEDLLTQLQSLKTYYPETNIIWSTEIEPYINFDYKLNLPAWLEDKDNKDIIYDKKIEEITKKEDADKYSSTFFENMFALQRTGDVYTVRFPKWEVSQSTLGEKLDANAGLVCEASTPYTAGRNDYDDIPIFRTFDVNAYVDEEGIIHITAFKGDDNFKDEGKVDVFVLTMSYYEKTWEDDEYWYYSITDLPKEGYTIARECINRDGSIRSYALYGKYVLGDIGGKPYSSKNLIPAYYPYVTISAYHLVDYCRKRGSYYSGGLISDYKYIWTRFLLKFANTNSQNVLCGVNNYSAQYQISVPEENVKRVILTNARASYFVEGSCISIGDWEGATSIDRSNKKCHSIARNVKILSIEKVDDANTALNLELDEPIATTETTYVTTMHYRSGYSDKILGRDGSLGKDPKSAKYPIVISGIELMVGGYEIPANTMMNILSSNGDREVYVTNDARKLSTNVSENMKNWKKSKFKIQVQKTNTWQYITKMGIDTELGCVLPISAGESGSGSATGFADAIYCDNASSGQREFLLLGCLWYGSLAGLSCLSAYNGFSDSWWDCLARLSIGAVGGELT